MRALVVLLIAACGGAARTSEPVGNRAPPPPKPTCTEERMAALAKVLQTRWNMPSASIVRCVPGLFPTPGFFVEADDGDERRSGVVATDGHTLVPFDRDPVRLPSTFVMDCVTSDLDGDGIDEIVETWRRTAHGHMGSDNWLEIRRVSSGTVETILGPHMSVYHPALGSCSAALRLAGKTIVITVERTSSIPPSDCLTPGTHTFALDRRAIVEIDLTRVSRR